MAEYHNNNIEDEITLKDLILIIKDYVAELFRFKWIIVFLVLLFSAYFVWEALTTPYKYPANLTFMVNEDKASGLGGMSGILSSFGLKGGKGKEYNLEKILALARSNKIIGEALFEKATVDGKEDFLANHLIRIYKYHELWEEHEGGLKNFLYTKGEPENFSVLENSVFKSLYAKVVGAPALGVEGLMMNGINEDTGIMTLSLTSESEMFSIALIKTIYEKLGEFYILKSVEKQKQTFDLVKAKNDSIYHKLQQAEYGLADFRDSNRSLWSNKDELRELALKREVQMLKLMYGESLKNLEMADFTLKSQTPFVQSIDLPTAPIFPIMKSWVIALVLGLIAGCFTGGAFIVCRKIYRDVMADATT